MCTCAGLSDCEAMCGAVLDVGTRRLLLTVSDCGSSCASIVSEYLLAPHCHRSFIKILIRGTQSVKLMS